MRGAWRRRFGLGLFWQSAGRGLQRPGQREQRKVPGSIFARVSLAQLGKDRWQKAGWPCCRHQGHSARRIAEAHDSGGRKYLGDGYSRLLMSKILPVRQCLIMTLCCLCLRPLPLQPPRSMLGASDRQGGAALPIFCQSTLIKGYRVSRDASLQSNT